jgi:hypothetical protein
MQRNTRQSPSRLNRRAALGAGGAAAAALSLSRLHPAAAQDATPDATTRMMAMTSHPIVGAWLALKPSPVPLIFGADGTITLGPAPNYLDPTLGLTFQGPVLGAWEPVSERGAHFTAMQALTDADGTYVGTFTMDAHPVVNADGQRFTDTGQTRFIVRDATNAIVSDDTITDDQVGVRITPGALLLADTTPAAGTPTG